MAKVVLKLKVRTPSTIKSDVTNKTKTYKKGEEIEVYSDENGKVPSWISKLAETASETNPQPKDNKTEEIKPTPK